MRGNGLQAQRYVPIAELDALASDLVLDLLRRAGVAAYAEPAGPVTGPSLEAAAGAAGVPARDRLYVDERARGRAEQLVASFLEGVAEPAAATPDELAWEGIVAAYHAAPSDRVPDWPAIEDLGPDRPDAGESGPPERGTAEPAPGPPEPAPGPVRSRARPLGDDEHFVPPTPPPLPPLDPVTRAAWLAMAGGPAVLLTFILMEWYLPDWLITLCAAGFVGGFLTLVLRMPGRNPDDPEDPDQGAVV